LDIWAQFFIAPLFAPNATGDEVNAVNAEHEKNLRNDGRRFDAITKDIADPASQYHHFATGDTETLETNPAKQHIDVRAALVAFHQRFYVPSNMRLAVLGGDDLDTLEVARQPDVRSNQRLGAAAAARRAPAALPGQLLWPARQLCASAGRALARHRLAAAAVSARPHRRSVAVRLAAARQLGGVGSLQAWHARARLGAERGRCSPRRRPTPGRCAWSPSVAASAGLAHGDDVASALKRVEQQRQLVAVAPRPARGCRAGTRRRTLSCRPSRFASQD
jgi:hypothetical protein